MAHCISEQSISSIQHGSAKFRCASQLGDIANRPVNAAFSVGFAIMFKNSGHPESAQGHRVVDRAYSFLLCQLSDMAASLLYIKSGHVWGNEKVQWETQTRSAAMIRNALT